MLNENNIQIVKKMSFTTFHVLPFFLFHFIQTISTCLAYTNLPNGFHMDVDEIFLSAGHFHTCAIEYRPGIEFGGPVKCWGHNAFGQTNSPIAGTYVQVSCGHTHSCALNINETISCWGNGEVMGDGGKWMEKMQNNAFSPFFNPKGLFLQVSSGENHVCALSKDGSVHCWGRNDFGQSSPPSNSKFVQVSSGNGLTCALQRTGIVKCWGKNNEGQRNAPKNIQFKQISVGISHHCCGITIHDDIVCWGSNTRGQAENRQGKYIQVSTGPRSTCAITMDQSIECWGRRSRIPFENLNSTYYDQISLGKDHTCVMDTDSRIHCWYIGANLGGHKVPLGFKAATYS